MSRHRAPEDTAMLSPAPLPRVRSILQAGIPAHDTTATRRALPPVPPVVTR